ncbi:MAG: hypothetical protein AAGL49_07855 [Pseudomonadota bacterium]
MLQVNDQDGKLAKAVAYLRGPLLTLAPKVALSMATFGVNKAYNLFLIVIIGKTNGALGLGLFFLLFTIGSYVSVFSSFLIPNYFVRHGLAASVQRANFGLALTLSPAVAMIIGGLTGLALATFTDLGMAATSVAAAVALFAAYEVALLFLTTYYRAREKYAAQNNVTVGLRIADLVVLTILALSGSPIESWLLLFTGQRFVLIVLVIAFTGPIAAGWRMAYRILQKPLGRRAVAQRSAHALRYAAPLVPSGLLTVISRNGDRFFVAGFLGQEMLGIYGALYALGNLIGAVDGPFVNVLLPHLSKRWRNEGDKPAGDRQFFLAALVVYGAIALALLAGILALWPLVERFYLPVEAAAFEAGLLMVILVGGGTILMGVSRILAVRLYRGATGSVLISSTAIVLANFALNTALIPIMGLLGAALATVGSSLVGVTMVVLLNLRARRLNR